MAGYQKYPYTGRDEAAPEYENYSVSNRDEEDRAPARYHDKDVFGNEEGNTIRYKTLSWQLVSVLMIAEIVSNGMLSLPAALAVVGLIPGVILIVFLGVFATFTSWVLIQFKLRHPEVHNMGDAGLILFGPIGREVLSAGTVIFAVFATGSQLLAGQIALGALSDNKLCLMLYTGIFAIPTLLLSFPRTLDQLSWLCIPSCICILVAGVVGMAAAGVYPAADRSIAATVPTNFYEAFVSITNPVFAYAGHFMFFILISEMKRPQDAMKAAWTLQTFATSFYVAFAVVMYVYLGPTVASPAFSSLPTRWAKATYGIAIPNFLIAGSLYSHTAAKLFFIRLFRGSDHLHEHTLLGWGTWTILIIVMNGAAFVLAVGVPIFPYLVGIAASLFASWYTYGIAGAFWLHDTYHDKGGFRAWVKRPFMTLLNVLTFVAGAFICVAGTYVTIKLIVDAYKSGSVRPVIKVTVDMMESPLMNGGPLNGLNSLPERMAFYKHIDQTRQIEFDALAHQLLEVQAALDTVRDDLEDERATRRNYRRRAEEAESAIVRSQFVLALVDGDGYIFKNSFLKDASEAGGARAAHQLYSEIQNYVRANNIIEHSDFDVVVNVYANKTGLAKHLFDSGMIGAPGQLEAFFCSFTQSRSLFQFIDCGPGKERADAKLRDTYRFYAYNSHCRQIFLACCHDNGYVAELDKYRHDSIAAPKTTLVHAAAQAREYNNLSFPIARFGSVFETSTIVPRQRPIQYTPPHNDGFPDYPPASYAAEAPTPNTYSAVISPPVVHAAMPIRTAPTPAASVQAEAPIKSNTPIENQENQPPKTTGGPAGDVKGIPINRAGQRIDRRMQIPSTQQLEQFEARIRFRKLCNEHHLRDNCYQYNCKYDHDPIDSTMKNTLRYKARAIPCQQGMKCRRGDCYYGHQCPWGSDSCTNPKCAFIKAGLHDITNLDVAKLVAPAPVVPA